MNDLQLKNLAERFAGHEMDVDPGTWSAISGQLAVASGSSLSGLLQEKFAGHEAPVDPQVWTNISSQLGHGAAAGVGSTTGWWAAGIAATLVVAGSLVYTSMSEPATKDVAAKIQVAPPSVPETQTAAQPFAQETASVPSAPVIADANTQAPKNSGSPSAAIAGPGTPEDKTPTTAANSKPIDPPPSPEGEKTVNTVLQSIVDNYVTSIDVLNTEPKVPLPSEEEMPSKAVHTQHDEPEPDQQEPAEPEVIEVVQAAALEVMIPTAFSPNGDGVNDELAVTVQNYQKATVRIFSASSNATVFSADNLEARWNGRMMNSGQTCEPGMYFYALEVTTADGRTWSKGEVVRLFQR